LKLQLAKDEEVDADVTWEDQDNINSFGRLNQRLHEIRDEVKAKRVRSHLSCQCSALKIF
jgi:prefoldin subunit 4